jgi:hypothetical protein
VRSEELKPFSRTHACFEYLARPPVSGARTQLLASDELFTVLPARGPYAIDTADGRPFRLADLAGPALRHAVREASRRETTDEPWESGRSVLLSRAGIRYVKGASRSDV